MKFANASFVLTASLGLALCAFAGQSKTHRLLRSAQSAVRVGGAVAGGMPGGSPGRVLVRITSGATAPPQVAAPQRIRVGGEVEEAKFIGGPDPEYSGLAQMGRIQGTVRLAAVINKEGKVQTLKVLSGHPLLVGPALTAVSQWRYQPTLLNGEPVEVETEIEVHIPPPIWKPVSFTGCLQNGDEPSEFRITSNGKTYDLIGTSRVRFEENLGHKVKVAGRDVTKIPIATEKVEGVAGHLWITKLKMLSETCP